MKTMNHIKYPKSLKSKSNLELRYIIRDAIEAIEANPDNPNNSYYADEMNYCSNELRERNSVSNITSIWDDLLGNPIAKNVLKNFGVKKINSLQELNKIMLNALKEAEPWLILLGDKIGNGIPSDPNGRCRAVLAVRNAIAKAENE